MFNEVFFKKSICAVITAIVVFSSALPSFSQEAQESQSSVNSTNMAVSATAYLNMA